MRPQMQLESVFDVLFPPMCAACDRVGSGLCLPCRPPAERRERFAIGGLACFAVGPYEGTLVRAVLALKAGRRDVASALGEMLGGLALAPELAGAVLVPVPTTPRRRLRRGFDQAVVLAAAAGRASGAPVVEALVRVGGAPQHGRGRADRLGAAGRFAVRQAPPAGAGLVLVDDVVTT